MLITLVAPAIALAQQPDAAAPEVEAAEVVWASLAAVGVDMDDVAATLEREGVSSFQKSFTELIDALDAKSAEFRAG